MRLVDGAETIKQFHRADWQFQRSFRTPLKSLAAFVRTILTSLPKLQEASIAIEEVVFEPKHLFPLLDEFEIERVCRPGVAFECSPEETSPFLEAALGDWLNFIFVPIPKDFVMFGHHDEFVTFFTHNRSKLNRVVEPLTAKGFQVVEHFEWKPSQSNRGSRRSI
jgi:hypothetical protein